jgi:competence CoiA-like predicted nuclease
MPLTARLEDGSTICSLNYSSGSEIRDKGLKLFSPYPDVNVEMFPRDCDGKVLHFVHKRKTTETYYAHHPESLAHVLGKVAVGKHYEKMIGERQLKNRVVRFEVPIESKKRICDVCIINSLTGSIERVGEVQLASITTSEISQRTADYEELGIQTSWFLGGQANTSANVNWCSEYLGVCWEIVG